MANGPAEARTPVLVGVGAITHRPDAAGPREPIDLMGEAVRRALADAGDGFGSRVDMVAVPRGLWTDRNPAITLARSIGAPDARTVLAEVGVLQQSLVSRVCSDIAAGRIRVGIVCGGEARASEALRRRRGEDRPSAPEASSAPPEPDEILVPGADIVTATEVSRDLAVPANQYAVIESALRHMHGHDAARHRRHLGELWARFAAIAAGTDDAWDRRGLSGSEIVTPDRSNRMIADPYTRLLCSQWTVDQAGALLFASAADATEVGVDRSRWVFPLAAAESNAVIPLPERRDLHRWPAFAVAADAALDAAGVDMDRVGLVDLYSCFPAAVQVQALELGLPLDRRLTVTGGMTFGGGPFNNATIQTIVAMSGRLRREPGAVAMVTGVSGLLTKPAVGLWGTDPPQPGFAAVDVSDAARAATGTCPLAPDGTGTGTVVGNTVIYEASAPARAVAVIELATGARTVAICDEPAAVADMTARDWVGRSVDVGEPGRFG